MGIRISQEKEDLIHSMRTDGRTIKEIAEYLQVSLQCVSDHLNPESRAKRYADTYARTAKDKQDPEKMERILARRKEYYYRIKIKKILGDNWNAK
jgi:predicted transcriptional regulator